MIYGDTTKENTFLTNMFPPCPQAAGQNQSVHSAPSVGCV